MTENFDNFVRGVVEERYRRCRGPTLPELSDNPRYIFSRCAPNPYTSGFKRIYYLKRGEPLTVDKCNNDPEYGTAKYEECRLAKIAQHKRMQKRKKKAS